MVKTWTNVCKKYLMFNKKIKKLNKKSKNIPRNDIKMIILPYICPY